MINTTISHQTSARCFSLLRIIFKVATQGAIWNHNIFNFFLESQHSPNDVEIASTMLEQRENIVYAKITIHHIGIFDGFHGFEGLISCISKTALCLAGMSHQACQKNGIRGSRHSVSAVVWSSVLVQDLTASTLPCSPSTLVINCEKPCQSASVKYFEGNEHFNSKEEVKLFQKNIVFRVMS